MSDRFRALLAAHLIAAILRAKRMSSVGSNQHQVPKFLLRYFASGDDNHLFVFDKLNERTRRRPITRVASRRGFYDCEIDTVLHSLEQPLSKVEGVSSRFINRIVEARSLRVLSRTGRKMVALFATVQMLRTAARRKQLRGMIGAVHNAVISLGGDPENVEGFPFLNEEQTRAASITSLRWLASELMPYFLNKSWVLYSTTQEHPFYISDNPVTRFNRNQLRFLSTLGLRARGIEIYLPLSDTLCLGFLCPTIKLPFRVRLFGGTLKLRPANVEHFNSLQVLNAEQFVYSQRDDFALVREMIRQVPEVKLGPGYC